MTEEIQGLEDRARGVMLALMTGDSLGAGVEGFPPEEIRRLSQEMWGSNLVEDFFPAVHMGTYVAGTEVGQYKAALDADAGMNFVATGPPTSENVAKQCARKGTYTDDTNTALALASSLVECQMLDPEHCANRYVQFWKNGDYVRGYPPSAKSVMKHIEQGTSYLVSGLPPCFPFPGGSYANGGAMRISPLALVLRHANPTLLRQACELAIISSHVHPEAVDGAVVQCAAVVCALKSGQGVLRVEAMMTELISHCRTPAMTARIQAVLDLWKAECNDKESTEDDVVLMRRMFRETKQHSRPGSGLGFQVAAVDAMPCVLWTVCRYWKTPVEALQRAVDLGGDTDTVACMVGAIMGALHGSAWLPEKWIEQLENGQRGRDYAVRLAHDLVKLNFNSESFIKHPSVSSKK